MTRCSSTRSTLLQCGPVTWERPGTAFRLFEVRSTWIQRPPDVCGSMRLCVAQCQQLRVVPSSTCAPFSPSLATRDDSSDDSIKDMTTGELHDVQHLSFPSCTPPFNTPRPDPYR